MKKENINNYYTDEDLVNFNKLNNFKEIKINNPSSNRSINHPFKYSVSDSNNFNKILNIKNNKKFSSKKIHKQEENTYYNSSDFQKFNKLKQLTNLNINKDKEKKNEYPKTTTKYTSNDFSKFDSIIKTENQSTKNSEINNKKIRIVDFNKLKEKEKNIKNKLGIEKIKIVYFD